MAVFFGTEKVVLWSNKGSIRRSSMRVSHKNRILLYSSLILFFVIATHCPAQELETMDENAFKKAVSRYRKAVRKDETNLALHRRMIEEAQKANKISVPLYIYQESYKKHPEHPIVLYVLGYTYLVQGTEESLAKAEEYLKQAVEKKPDLVDAHAALGRCYLKREKKELALKELEASIAFDPQFAPAYLDLARYYRFQKDYQEAIKYYTKSLEIAPKSAEGHFELGSIYFDLADYEAAAREFTEALKYDEKLASAYYKLGQIYALQNQPERAVELYKQGRKYSPKDIKARYKLAHIFLDQDNGRYAILSLRSALALDPMYEGEIDKLKDVSTVEAARVIEEMLAKNPENHELQHFLGKLQLKLGEKDTAKEHLEKATELKPESGDVRAQLGKIYEEEEPSKAMEEYKQAAQLGSKQASILLPLAETYRKEGDEVKLLETLEQIATVDKSRHEVHFELATIYKRKAEELKKSSKNLEYQRMLDKAIEHCDQAVKITPANPKYHLLLATLYAKQGKLKAMREFDEAIKILDPKVTQDLVEKTSTLIEKEELRRRMGEAGRQEIETGKFSIEKRNEKLKRIFDEATA